MLRRSTLPDTEILTFRIDLLTAKMLRSQAKSVGISTAEYLRMITSRHVFHVDIADDIKKEVKQSLLYAQSAYADIVELKQRITDLEKEIQDIRKQDKGE